MLGLVVPVAGEAAKHWESALLSVAAYGRTDAGKKRGQASGYLDADAELARAGWTRWQDFPNDGLSQKISGSGLRVEVWHKAADNVVAVAFGGTVFTSGKDWKSNLRWFLPKHRDEYTDIVDYFAQAFIAEYEIRMPHDDALGSPQVVLRAAGHSLGGGLAQQFAYALPLSAGTPRVVSVHVFDPSPVTGFYSVGKALRDHNKKVLHTDRAYERGELLSIVRSFLAVFAKPSRACPAIRGVRYQVFKAWLDPIAGHSMEKLASGLQSVSGNGKARVVGRLR